MRYRCAILDDYQIVALQMADWSKVSGDLELKVFDKPLGAFQAIADPTRRRILEELAKRDDQTLYELCVRMLTVQGVDMTRQGIEKHLIVLEEAGLVVSERRGKYKVLRLDADPLRMDHDTPRPPGRARRVNF
jgi:DNA-binding transcriptional ArsR family regulator